MRKRTPITSDALCQRWCKGCKHPNYFEDPNGAPDTCRLCGSKLTTEPRGPQGQHLGDARQRYILHQRRQAKLRGEEYNAYREDKEAYALNELRKAARLARRRELAEKILKMRKDTDD